jgi:hypothetical protein
MIYDVWSESQFPRHIDITRTSTPDTSTSTSTQAKTQIRSTQHAYEGKHTRNARNKIRPRHMQQKET